MHYSAKQQRINGKVKNHNSQMPPPYNAGIHYLSTPNVSNTGQLQINRKYINNMGNINHVSFLQYQRTTNMQLKNDLEMNHYQNLRHHQHHHAFVYKAPQYHKVINPNIHQKMSVNHLMQRKMFKEQTIPAGVLQQNPLNVDLTSRKCKELPNQEPNKLYNKHKTTQAKFRKLNSKGTNNEKGIEVTDINLIEQNQVLDTLNPPDENMPGNKENNDSVPQNGITQTLNNGQSDADKCEDATDKSAKSAREKTPMCLINDLARFNKISFQYRLTSENGPAHCKRFTVTLILGDEEYTAEGLKIKQAQHLAAKEAIEKTKYKHPTPKTNRTDDSNTAKSNITPTVELNALAMKLGQQTYYIFDPQQIENNSNYLLTNNAFEINNTVQQQNPNGIVENLITNSKQVVSIQHTRQYLSKFQNRYTQFQHTHQNNSAPAAYAYFPPSSPCKITLIVGTKEFIGVGRTIQQAKHDAASHALKVLKEQLVTGQLETQNESIEDNDSKSPISLVFEIGIKRSLPVDFKVLREEGPAHMRTFITACIVGDIVTEGEGTGKKISKKKAAQKMLEELKKLPITPVASPIKRTKLKKTCADRSKNDSLVESEAEVVKICHKNKKVTLESEATNPINKLLEWHQNQKESEPEFKLISEIGKENVRRKQFVMEVSSNKIVARGVGNSKKLAKQNAAQNFLIAIAESNGQATTSEVGNSTKTAYIKEINKNDTETTNKMGHSKNPIEQGADENFRSAETGNNLTSATTIAAVEQNGYAKKSTNNSELKANATETNSQRHLGEETCLEQESIEKTAKASSSVASTDAATKDNTNSGKNSTKSQNHHMKDQLMYLAKLLGFDVEFSDYPKGNHDEFLTIVMLSTTPPQICHGVGANANESQEDAARNALKILSEMGLNNAVKS